MYIYNLYINILTPPLYRYLLCPFVKAQMELTKMRGMTRDQGTLFKG